MHGRPLLIAALLTGLIALDLDALQRAPEPCDQLATDVRSRPDDLDAAARLGQCSVRDYVMVAPGGDSTRLAFRSSWSTALRALRHAVTRDPAFARAYRPLFSILFATTRDGCSTVTWECLHVSPVRRDGDSLLTIPRPVRPSPGRSPYDEVLAQTATTRRGNLAEARDLAARWAQVAPDDWRPHHYLGRALTELGDPEAAVTELERAAALGDAEARRTIFWDRVDALLRTSRGAQTARVLDEAINEPGRDTTLTFARRVSQVNEFIGRLRPPPIDSSPAMMALRARGRARMDSVIRAASTRTASPPSFGELLAAGDSAGARRMLARQDSMWPPATGSQRAPLVDERTLNSATMHLALGDTAGAEQRLAEIEQALSDRRFPEYLGLLFGGGRPWLGRAWLLSADLAAARGRADEAKRVYQRLIGLWEAADPDHQPLVKTARQRLARLP